MKVPISGWPLKLNVSEVEKTAATTFLKWITKGFSVSWYVASSPFLKEQRMHAKSIKLLRSCARLILPIHEL